MIIRPEIRDRDSMKQCFKVLEEENIPHRFDVDQMFYPIWVKIQIMPNYRVSVRTERITQSGIETVRFFDDTNGAVSGKGMLLTLEQLSNYMKRECAYYKAVERMHHSFSAIRIKPDRWKKIISSYFDNTKIHGLGNGQIFELSYEEDFTLTIANTLFDKDDKEKQAKINSGDNLKTIWHIADSLLNCYEDLKSPSNMLSNWTATILNHETDNLDSKFLGISYDFFNVWISFDTVIYRFAPQQRAGEYLLERYKTLKDGCLSKKETECISSSQQLASFLDSDNDEDTSFWDNDENKCSMDELMLSCLTESMINFEEDKSESILLSILLLSKGLKTENENINQAATLIHEMVLDYISETGFGTDKDSAEGSLSKFAEELGQYLELLDGKQTNAAPIRPTKRFEVKKVEETKVEDYQSEIVPETTPALATKDEPIYLGDEKADEEELSVNRLNVKPIRSVFFYSNFLAAKEDASKTCTLGRDEFDNMLSEFLMKAQTYGKQEILSLYSRGVHGRMISGNILKKGFPESSLTRLYFCFGNAFGKNKKEIVKDDDIILLDFTTDLHNHDNYEEYMTFLSQIIKDEDESTLTNASTKSLQFHRGGKLFEWKYSEGAGGYVYFPVPTEGQIALVEGTLLITPPSVVLGSAGTGKTTLCEELYHTIKERNPNAKVLYISYLGFLCTMVETYIKQRYQIDAECSTFDELLKRDLIKRGIKKSDEIKGTYKNSRFFYEWAGVYGYKQGIHKNYSVLNENRALLSRIYPGNHFAAAAEAYIIFRTVTEGDNVIPFSDKTAYLQKLKAEEGLSNEKKDAIFELCKRYGKFLDEKGYLTDNNAASILESKGEGVYDAVIIDEVQDVTPPLIGYARSLLKKDSLSIYAFGDDNQTINPTLMRVSKVSSELKSSFERAKVKIKDVNPYVLKEGSFRCSSSLLNYVNYMTILRKNAIGSDKDYNDKEQTSFEPKDNEGCRAPIYIKNIETINQIITSENLFVQNSMAIITPNQSVKDKLVERSDYLCRKQNKKPFIGQKSDYILNVEEIKGGERDIIILYGFLSSEQSIWSELIAENEKSLKKSTIHRMYFNRFYVGVTRAKKSLIIIEDNNLPDDVEKTILPYEPNKYTDVPIITRLDDQQSWKGLFTNETQHYDWYSKARQAFGIGNYYDALSFMKNARDLLLSTEEEHDAKVEEDYQTLVDKYETYKNFDEKCRAGDTFADEHEISEYIRAFADYGDIVMLKKALSFVDRKHVDAFESNDYEFVSSYYKTNQEYLKEHNPGFRILMQRKLISLSEKYIKGLLRSK